MGQGTALVSATVALRLPDGSSSGLQRLQRFLGLFVYRAWMELCELGAKKPIKLDHDFRRQQLDHKRHQSHSLVSIPITALAPLGACCDVAALDFGMLPQWLRQLCHLMASSVDYNCLLRHGMYNSEGTRCSQLSRIRCGHACDRCLCS